MLKLKALYPQGKVRQEIIGKMESDVRDMTIMFNSEEDSQFGPLERHNLS
jgi:hypothetical protein